MRYLSLILILPLLLISCGFHLRGMNQSIELPFKTIYINAAADSSVGADLKRAMQTRGGVKVVEDMAQAEAVLYIMSESREKTILSLSGGGRVREFQLLYRLNFRLVNSNQKELIAPAAISLRRDLSFNDEKVLAKEAEEALLYRDMQQDAIQQIFWRLNTIKDKAN